jgi:hypothetical protein
MTDLAKRTCKPCEGGTSAMGRDEAEGMLAGLEGWRLSGDASSIRRHFEFKGFLKAVEMAKSNPMVDKAQQVPIEDFLKKFEGDHEHETVKLNLDMTED